MKKFITKLLFSTLAIAAALSCAPAIAEDQFFSLYGSEVRDNTSPEQKTYTFQFEYLHDWSDHFSFSVDNGNLGHFNQGIEHHEDNDGANFWAHTDLFDHQLRLAAGVGGMLYYDTTGGTYQHANEDVHGFGTSYALSATLYTFKPLLFQVRANWINAGSVDTRALMFGVGYQLDGNSWGHSSLFGGRSAGESPDQTNNELTFYGGKAVINEPGNGHSTAFAVEYRRDLGSYFQWTESLLDEGKSALADRRGIVSEGWLAKSFFSDHLSLGVGAGLYLAEDSLRPGAKTFVTPIRSYTIAYNITPHFDVRATWDRPITNDGRDSDVALFGFGYRF